MGRLLGILLLLAGVAIGIGIVRYADESHTLLPFDFEETPVVDPYEEWRQYVSAIGHFRADFPTTPQTVSEDLPVPNSNLIVKSHIYVSEDIDGTTYMINVIVYPSDIQAGQTDRTLEKIMNDMVAANPTNRVRSVDFTEFQGYRTLDFFIENPQVYVNCRVFLVGKRLYLLVVIDKVEQYRDQDFQHFLEKFKVLSDSPDS
ncbi:hypothetical protein SCG7086_AF_00200 [Chlamydiales bacterium SCGC AG-110-P3]|nr:hypothetical protein SCG7086_AF_00200 [Chlamydiales bacterium SCGC AG-110-P3]